MSKREAPTWTDGTDLSSGVPTHCLRMPSIRLELAILKRRRPDGSAFTSRELTGWLTRLEAKRLPDEYCATLAATKRTAVEVAKVRLRRALKELEEVTS